MSVTPNAPIYRLWWDTTGLVFGHVRHDNREDRIMPIPPELTVPEPDDLEAAADQLRLLGGEDFYDLADACQDAAHYIRGTQRRL